MRRHVVLCLAGLLGLVVACGPDRLRFATPPPPTSSWLSPVLGPTATLAPTRDRRPTPTWTPTVTPTPVIYTVKKGDVLGAIALEQNVSIEAIMLANGLPNAHMLSIGQKLIIPNEAMLQEMARRGLDVRYASPTPAFPTPTLRVASIAWDQAAGYIGQEVSLEGRIVRTRQVSGAVYLYFQERLEGAVRVYIPPEGVRNLAAQPEVYYLDRWVLVRGTVEESDDQLQVIVRRRAQISLLE